MLKPDYQALYDSMLIDPKAVPAVATYTRKQLQFKDRYMKVGQLACPTEPLPWYFVGLIHHMESGQNFDRHLHNGDPLTARTIHVPIGRPIKGNPPFLWDDSAIDALVNVMGYGTPRTWSIPETLDRLEGYNGFGYQHHDVYTPYLWSRTNHYTKGLYVSDGKYNPDAISQQLGVAPILKALLTVNNDTKFANPNISRIP